VSATQGSLGGILDKFDQTESPSGFPHPVACRRWLALRSTAQAEPGSPPQSAPGPAPAAT